MKIFVRSPYNYDVTAASDETAIAPGGPSLTVQSMTEDSDLNVMMQRFGVTGKMPDNVRLPTYGDFSHVTDYRSAIEAAYSAEESFLQFPAHIRAEFQNNPQLFLSYVENPANIERVKQWFPKENLNERHATGGVTSQGSSEGPSGGARPAERSAGAGVSERSPEPGSGK